MQRYILLFHGFSLTSKYSKLMQSKRPYVGMLASTELHLQPKAYTCSIFHDSASNHISGLPFIFMPTTANMHNEDWVH